jgi:hypothetical protein
MCAHDVGRRLLAVLAVLILAAGCTSNASLTPTTTLAPAPPTVALTVSQTLAPTQSASVSPCEERAPHTSFFCATKNGEGGHGGPPLLDLPGQIAFDYRVSGACIFSLGLSTETSAVGLPSLTMTVSGPEISGTWRMSIKAGRYYPVISEAVGCLYSVNVRDDR